MTGHHNPTSPPGPIIDQYASPTVLVFSSPKPPAFSLPLMFSALEETPTGMGREMMSLGSVMGETAQR